MFSMKQCIPQILLSFFSKFSNLKNKTIINIYKNPNSLFLHLMNRWLNASTALTSCRCRQSCVEQTKGPPPPDHHFHTPNNVGGFWWYYHPPPVWDGRYLQYEVLYDAHSCVHMTIHKLEKKIGFLNAFNFFIIIFLFSAKISRLYNFI